MEEENTEELNQDGISEEGTEEINEEESSEETENNKETEQPAQEYTKERFDGLMSKWQEDRRVRLDLEKQVKDNKTTSEKTQEDKYLDYIYSKVEEKRATQQQAEDTAAKLELKEVQVEYPNLKKDDILDKAVEYRINLSTAAKILQDINKSQEVGKKLTTEEIKRKELAGKIGGKSGTSPEKGLTPYDPKLTMEENIEQGKKELGL